MNELDIITALMVVISTVLWWLTLGVALPIRIMTELLIKKREVKDE